MKTKIYMKGFLAITMLLCTTHTWAYNFSAVNDEGVTIYYNILSEDDLTCEVTCRYDALSYKGTYTGSVVIPETITYSGKTYTVVGIGDYTFYYSSSLTEIAIPNSVTNIGSYAFYNCSSLTEIAIPNSVTNIGSYAFGGCSSLTEVTIPNSVTSIEARTFESCPKLAEINLPNSVTNIGSSAFGYCSSLIEVTIPNSVTSIGSSAFQNCSSLTEVTIPHSVTSIEDYTFRYCTSLTEITIPNSVTSIGSSAFQYCSSLTEVTIPNSVTNIGSSAFEGCSNLTEVTIPNSVTSIEDYTFNDCSSLTEMTIPNSVTTIGSSAFFNCLGLTQITIPNSVISIGTQAFYNCLALTTLILEDGEEILAMTTSSSSTTLTNCPLETLYLGRDVSYSSTYSPFRSNKKLTSLTIGEQVTDIPKYAFESCSGLKEVTFNAIACISAGTSSSPIFHNCSNINKLIIGENVTTIPAYMFYGCTNLTDIVSHSILPPTYESTTFESSILKAEVPKESIMKYVVDDKWEEIPTIYSIDDGNIYYPVPILCEGDAIVIANSGDEKGVALTEGTTATISSITGGQVSGIVQHGVEDVTETINGSGEYSFTVSQYHKINTIYSYAMTADNMYDLTVTQGGDILNQISVSKINDVYYLKVRGDINGDDISTIRRMPNLMVLDLSDANIVSGGGAYYDTYATEDNVVGRYFFADLSNLRYVSIPNSVTSIEQYAFQKCDGLTSMVIPGEVTSIGNYAFTGCTNLITLFFNEGEEEANISANSTNSRNPFNDCPIVSAYVDRKLSYEYSNAGTTKYASPFANKSTLVSAIFGDHISEIGSDEFYGSENLTQLTIGNSVTTIESGAFYECSSLTEVTIPNSVTSIGSSAFYGCSSLTEVVIPKSVTKIGSGAFNGCMGLTSLILEDSEESLAMSTNSSSPQFTNCPLETLYLGRDVSSYTFKNQTSLTSLTISRSVTTIYSSTFYGCTELMNVIIPNSVTSIGNSAFYGCTSLTELTIGESVTSIDTSAFQGCSNLETINSVNPTPPDITSSTFSGVEKETCVLNVPIGSLNAYWVHVYWGEFFNIKEVDFPDGIDNVGYNGVVYITGYYTLDGKKISSLQRGINIIRYSDGTAKKVLVK